MDNAVQVEKSTIWRVLFETPNFTFETFASSELDAREGLRRAWLHHCNQTGADPNYLEQYAGDINAQEIRLGVTYRDREVFFPPVSKQVEVHDR